MARRTIWTKAFNWPPFPSILLTVVFIMLNQILTRSFLSPYSLLGFLSSNTATMCVAMGASIVLIGGGVDLSVGATVSLVNVIFIKLVGANFGLVPAILIGIASAMAMAALNGIVVGFLRVNPLIATFATLSVAAGLALWILPTPSGSAPVGFINFYNGFLLGVPTPVYVIVVTAAVWGLIRSTPLGVWIYAVGNNQEKAFVSGLPVAWVKFWAFVIGGFFTGIGGLSLTASVSTGDPLIGLPITISAIAACVIGGVSLLGGKGDVFGAIFGGLFLGLVITLVLAAHISPFYQDVVSGLIILGGIIGASWVEKRREEISVRNRGFETP